jgi:flagellar hook-basal body complex protein FliE
MATDIRMTNAVNAYRDALKVADKILQDTTIKTPDATRQAMGPSFQDLVGGGLQNARDINYKSEAVSTQAIAGKADITDLVTAVANAEMALNTVVAVRDKVIGAYQEIIRMPI